MVLDDRGVVVGDPDPAPRMLSQPVDPPTSPPLLAEGDAVLELRAAMGSLAAHETNGSPAARVRAWVGRVSGRRNRYVLAAVVRATDEIAHRCDELATRLAEQEARGADVTRTFGEDLARLRAEVLHLQGMIDSTGGTARPAR